MTTALLADPVEREVTTLLQTVYDRYHQDFRGYSMASLRRRLDSGRIQLGCVTLQELEQKICEDARAFDVLLQHLTVQVTEMFRDPPFFRAFRERVVPVLRTYPSLKVWVAGCSTGEELYSYAILLHEEGLLDRTILYATDINPEALRRAKSGAFPKDRLDAFTENHRATGASHSLSQYYAVVRDLAVFDATLRKNVVFSDHSLATDNGFAEVQLVSCRNVLIYFDRALQERSIELIRGSLCRRGFLGLGSKETLQFSSSGKAFRHLDLDAAGYRWYQKI